MTRRPQMDPVAATTDEFESTPSRAPLFIVGNARTGSNLLRAILNRHPNVFVAQEFQLWLPHRKGFMHWFHEFGDLSQERQLKAFLDELYSLRPGDAPQSFRHGFWKRMDDWVPRDRLEDAFRDSDRSPRSFIRVVLSESASYAGKRIYGAKNPAHLAYLPRLLRWFPGARVVHLFRDPRAIYASQVRKKAGDRRWNVSTGNPLYRVGLAGFTTWEWWWAYATYLRYSKNQFYLRLRFEDLVASPTTSIRRVCEFLGITAWSAMQEVPVKASSFATRGEPGIDARAKDRWREHVGAAARLWFRVSCYPGMKSLGY